MDARNLIKYDLSVQEVIQKPDEIENIKKLVNHGDIVVFKNFESKETCQEIKKYVHGIILNNLEIMTPIDHKCNNYVRFSQSDSRATVPIYCNSVSFFQWNRDLYEFFNRYGDCYRLKNLIAGADPERYLNRKVEDDCTSRIACHFYPEGKGYLGAHTDPIGKHQEITSTLILDIGKSHGYYVCKENNEKWYFEHELEVGDFYIGDPILTHGVDTAGSEDDFDPLSINGRWGLLFPVNKIATNTKIADSVKIDI